MKQQRMTTFLKVKPVDDRPPASMIGDLLWCYTCKKYRQYRTYLEEPGMTYWGRAICSECDGWIKELDRPK